jgi:HlyD family secretion protein
MKPLMEAVYASGHVVSGEEYQLFAQAEGYVTEKLVSDGDEVKKGEALYIISSDQQTARNRIARETFDIAQKNYGENSPVLTELRAAVECAVTKMQFDSANYERYNNLLKNNATSRIEYERIKLIYENSRNEYHLQKARYERTRNQTYLEYQNAKNNLLISSDEAGRYVIKSDVDGKVFMTSKEKGEMIRRSELVAVIGKDDRYFLQLNVDELDVQKLKPGQEVLVRIDAYPDRIFKAEITKVYPMVDRKQQAVRADALLKEKLPGMFSGLAVEANIIIRQKENAIVIPKNSLLPGDSVVVKSDDGQKKIKVTKGIETLDEVEIVEGLDTNAFIVMRPDK